MWPLMLYEVAISHVETMEMKISSFIRKWLGIPRCLSNLAFYSHGNKLQLPLTALTEEFKVTKARFFMTLHDSEDQVIRDTLPDVKTGHKWSVSEEIDSMESQLYFHDIVGATQTGRSGLGMSKHTYFHKSSVQDKRQLVLEEIRVSQEEVCQAKAASMSQQGAWMKWESAEARSLSWADIWSMEPLMLKFLLRSTYNVLPSPANLKIWKLIQDDKCQKCPGRATAEHILNGCPASLSSGMYKWRHDQVLKEIDIAVRAVVNQVNEILVPSKSVKHIDFVKEGGEVFIPQVDHQTGILHSANDWTLLLDIDEQLSFPPEIVFTNLRPDIVIWSQRSKTVIIGELTVPWEDNFDTANEFKQLKYTDLIEECVQRGWKVYSFPFEVGSRGYISKTCTIFLSKIGIGTRQRKSVLHKISQTATKASAWIWKKYQMLVHSSS